MRSVGEPVPEKNRVENGGYGIFVRSTSPIGSEKMTVRVSVSNPSGNEDVEFTVMREHFETLDIKIGRIGDDMLPELEYFAKVSKAYSSACSSFAYTYCSTEMLRKKLLQKGFPKDVCDDAVECVKRRGFVNENEIAIRRAQVLAEKHWGRSRIIAKLREEGFDSLAVTAAIDQLEEIDFVAICAEHIRKKYGAVPVDQHKRELMYASLMRMGYSASEIKEALNLLN